jgi:hypothetical protein
LYVINVLANIIRRREYSRKSHRGTAVATQTPPILNDHSIWQISVPYFGELFSLIRIVRVGNLFKFAAQEAAALSAETLPAVTLYLLGKYITILYNKDMQIRAYRSKDEDLDFMRGTSIGLAAVAPKPMSDMLQNNTPATAAIMRYVAPKIMAPTVEVLQKALETEFDARGWTSGGSAVVVEDWFDTCYDIAVRCNTAAFLKNMSRSASCDF